MRASALFATTMLVMLVATAAQPSWAAAQDAVPGVDAEYVEYVGVAYQRRAQTFLYREHHVLAYRAGRLSERIVLYTCADGTPFARKNVTYADAQVPDFVFDDAATGMQEGIRMQGVERFVFFRANRNDPQKTAPLPHVAGLVADTGFDDFIRAHWSDLMNGLEVPLQFLVPSRLQAVSFEVQHLRAESMDGRPAEVFRLKLSGLLGVFLSGIDVTYDREQHVLVRFDGLSDVRDAAGDNLQANIVFHLSDRRRSTAQAFANAERASIAPCH